MSTMRIEPELIDQPGADPAQQSDNHRVKDLLSNELVQEWADRLANAARQHRIRQGSRTDVKSAQRIAILVTEELLKAAGDDLGLRLVHHIGDLEWEVFYQAKEHCLVSDQLPREVPPKRENWGSFDPLKLQTPAREQREKMSPLCRIAFMVLMANGGEMLPEGLVPSRDLSAVEIFPAIGREVDEDEVRRQNGRKIKRSGNPERSGGVHDRKRCWQRLFRSLKPTWRR